jgi:hypothetical protein
LSAHIVITLKPNTILVVTYPTPLHFHLSTRVTWAWLLDCANMMALFNEAFDYPQLGGSGLGLGCQRLAT